jgi:hypothetical protein
VSGIVARRSSTMLRSRRSYGQVAKDIHRIERAVVSARYERVSPIVPRPRTMLDDPVIRPTV